LPQAASNSAHATKGTAIFAPDHLFIQASLPTNATAIATRQCYEPDGS
jgi:hypothetical protein